MRLSETEFDLKELTELLLDIEKRNKWWEKTVEYYFFSKYMANDRPIFPLNGNEEVIGDAITEKEGLWSIIEFKANKTCLNSEYDKFVVVKNKNLKSVEKKIESDNDPALNRAFVSNAEGAKGFIKEKAIRELYSESFTKKGLRDEHHHLVYGNFDSVLELKAETYFTRQEMVSVDEVFDNGTDLATFQFYLKELCLAKAPVDGGKSGNEEVNMDVLSSERWIIGCSINGSLYVMRLKDMLSMSLSLVKLFKNNLKNASSSLDL
jgi:hypothetical protein